MKTIRAFAEEASGKFLFKSPFYAKRIVLANGGVLETQAGTDIIAVDGDGAVTTTTAYTAGTVTSNSANALAIGPNGATNPVIKVDASASSCATGVEIVGAAAAGGASLRAISSGTNEALSINAKGSGAINIGDVSTGAVAVTPATTFASSAKSTSATAGVGYGTGAGGTVTQGTSRTTGVTLNKVCGAITLVSAAGSATPASFTVTNSAVAATDTVVVNQKSGTDKYIIEVTALGAGSFEITSYTTGGTTTEQPVFNFSVIKAVAS